MVTKRVEHPRPETPWTETQRARLVEIITEYRECGAVSVPWRSFTRELGHDLKAVYAMAHYMRAKMAKKARDEYRALVRALADNAPDPRPFEPPVPRKMVTIGSYEPSRCTSTARMRFAAEWRNRIAEQDITAAQFGDPLPGKSALDKKRSSTIEHSHGPGAGHKIMRSITLATRPWQPSKAEITEAAQ